MVGAEAFASWFQGARFELIDDRVKVVAGTSFAARIISQNFADAVKLAATEVAGHSIVSATILVVGEEQATEVAPIETILRAVAPDDAQPDFFIPELSEVALKDDVHLMEMTPFTLNGRNETRRELVYTSPQGLTLRVKAA